MSVSTQRTLRNMARMIFDMRGVDYTKVEYRLGNFHGSGRVAVVVGNHELVRYEDEEDAA